MTTILTVIFWVLIVQVCIVAMVALGLMFVLMTQTIYRRIMY